MNEAMKCDRCGKMVDAVYPHTCTPLALRLADAIDLGWLENVDPDKADIDMIQTELRRLSAVNAELLEALKFVMSAHGEQLDWAFEQARAAIAKAGGEA